MITDFASLMAKINCLKFTLLIVLDDVEDLLRTNQGLLLQFLASLQLRNNNINVLVTSKVPLEVFVDREDFYEIFI